MSLRAPANADASREGNLQIAKTPVRWPFLWCVNMMCGRAYRLLTASWRRAPHANAPPGAPDSPSKKKLSESHQKARCGRSRDEESIESAQMIRKARSPVSLRTPAKAHCTDVRPTSLPSPNLTED